MTELSLPLSLGATIESVLFFKGTAVSFSELSKIIGITESEVNEAIVELSNNLIGRGITLILNNNTAELATNPQNAQLIESINNDEISKDLSKASLETLTIIAYKGPLSRIQIDHIRGVNSQHILRSLQMRGLVQKDATDDSLDSVSNKSRVNKYIITNDALAYMGLTHISELPEYESMRKELSTVVDSALEYDH